MSGYPLNPTAGLSGATCRPDRGSSEVQHWRSLYREEIGSREQRLDSDFRITRMAPIFSPRNVPLNLYRHDAILSIELMESFVSGVESQAAEAVVKFLKEKQLVPNTDGISAMTVHQSLDDESWDLETIFTEYFPNLQRRSALLTLHSFFEHELGKLCALFKSGKGYALDVSDLKSKGIDRSTLYLERVVGLNVCKGSQDWAAIKKIQLVRNLIAHRDGKVQEDHDAAILKFIDDCKWLDRKDDGELVIEKGFLAYVVNTYGKYFKLLSESIAAQGR